MQDAQDCVDRSGAELKVMQAIPAIMKVGGMLEYLQAVATRSLVEEDGQALTEYGLVLVLVSIIGIALLTVLGGKVAGLLHVSF
jgi:Flp pilus assembly pilin Flp